MQTKWEGARPGPDRTRRAWARRLGGLEGLTEGRMERRSGAMMQKKREGGRSAPWQQSTPPSRSTVPSDPAERSVPNRIQDREPPPPGQRQGARGLGPPLPARACRGWKLAAGVGRACRLPSVWNGAGARGPSLPVPGSVICPGEIGYSLVLLSFLRLYNWCNHCLSPRLTHMG